MEEGQAQIQARAAARAAAAIADTAGSRVASPARVLVRAVDTPAMLAPEAVRRGAVAPMAQAERREQAGAVALAWPGRARAPQGRRWAGRPGIPSRRRSITR